MDKNYTKQTLKIFWQHLSKYKFAVFVVFFSITLASIANLINPLFYKEFFDILAGSGETAAKSQILIQILFKVLAVNLVGWVLWRLATFFIAFFESKTMADLYNSCFAYLHKHSVSFFNNNFVGSLVKRVNRFPRSFEVIVDSFFFELLQILVSMIFIVVVLLLRNIFLGLGVLVWIIIFCAINYYFSLYKLKHDLIKSKFDSEVTGVLADTITNSLNVKLFNGYNREKRLFKKVTTKLQKQQLFCWNLNNKFEAIQTFLMVLLELGVFYLMVRLWQRGIVTIGDFVLVQAYILTIFIRLWSFGRIIRRYYEHLADANEMTEILQTFHEIQDVRNARELLVEKGRIEFKNVSFSYHKTRRMFFRLNFNINSKEKVALVGPSGSGKSTLVNLLLRNYDLEGGKIYIDGQKISSVKQESLWQNISLVSQDPILFHRTLKENIRYGRPEASEQEVIKVAKLAYCHNFISQSPEGYKTYVGERGIKLSSGERQRIAIARAILKNSPILVLDEATSSLDSESEGLIQDALTTLMKGKTVVVIAHRLSTIMKMDRIIVLEKGKIIEEGTHQQLIKHKGGLYQQLWQKQVGGFIG
ncbi:ABC transporter ATP-binding protein/permease [Patescibacteria group bacterium]|nr:ABC transporter ATP-binding protein/permease [Patescibacteria group bacterium]